MDVFKRGHDHGSRRPWMYLKHDHVSQSASRQLFNSFFAEFGSVFVHRIFANCGFRGQAGLEITIGIVISTGGSQIVANLQAFVRADV